MILFPILFVVFHIFIETLLISRLFLQDEYSIFPQTYSIDINGYILVYSVTSNKRFLSPRAA